MSRSYKKTPVLKDSNTSKKANETWKIYDYRIYDVEKRWMRK